MLQYLKRNLPAPVATIKTPVTDNFSYDNGVRLEGFAEDDKGVKEVRLVIRNTGNNQYWNGSAWQTNYVQVQASIPNANDPLVKWSYEFHPPDNTDINCFVSARAFDINGAYPAGPDMAHLLAFRNFTIKAKPTMAQFVAVDQHTTDVETSASQTFAMTPLINQVVATGTSAMPATHEILGWAEDPQEIQRVELKIRQTLPNGTVQFWNGSSWTSSATQVDAVITEEQGTGVKWGYFLSPPHVQSAEIHIQIRTVDKSGDANEFGNNTPLNFSRRHHD